MERSRNAFSLDRAIELYGQGDFVAAAAIFADRAVTGDVQAILWLAACHTNGEGVAMNRMEAFRLYRVATEAGHSHAQTNVGVMLVQGDGCEKDVAAGLVWLERAAGQGDMGAQFNLATLLSSEKEVEPDFERSAKWYRAAAEQGHYPSQARLGFCYQHGRGVTKDRVQAYLWFALAAQHGVGTALVALERIMTDMSVEEKRDGAAMIQSWRRRTADVSSRAVINPILG